MKKIAIFLMFLFLAPMIALAQINLPSGDADLGAQINAAVAALPASGGKITVRTPVDGGCYSFATPVVITKAVIVEGQGPSTCLGFSGNGAAFSFYGNSVSFVPDSYPDGFGLRDLTLRGAGLSGGQTGIALGGTEYSVGFYGTGLTVTNFALGLQYKRGVWNFKMEHSTFTGNGQSVHWASSIHFGGENLEFDSVTFAGAVFAKSVEINDSNTDFSNTNSLTFISCNFDSAQLVIDNGSGSVRLYAPHFENAGIGSGSEPFVRIRAYTAATDVVMDGPDFYNDQNNPYPPSFIELDGGPAVTISQMRSVNLDGTANVPTNLLIAGDAFVTLLGDAPLRAAQKQYVIASGNPRLWAMGGQDPAAPATSGTASGSTVPGGVPPSSMPTFDASGSQIGNFHITTGKSIMPASGQAVVAFNGASQFTQTPTCTLSYQTAGSYFLTRALTSNPYPNQIVLFGQPYLGVYFICVGN
ncbi:MAG: hypothetical protein NVSMB62_09260 [Acidobacteriaceae bacterium]